MEERILRHLRECRSIPEGGLGKGVRVMYPDGPRQVMSDEVYRKLKRFSVKEWGISLRTKRLCREYVKDMLNYGF